MFEDIKSVFGLKDELGGVKNSGFEVKIYVFGLKKRNEKSR